MHRPPFQAFYQLLTQSPLLPWLPELPTRLESWLAQHQHQSAYKKGKHLLSHLPALSPSWQDLQTQVAIGKASELQPGQAEQMQKILQQLKPWRKGPFELFGLKLDTEWRSDWKWQRLQPHLAPLSGKTVLDIGCGSGYHLWRMRGAGAKTVIGVDPSLLFFQQFQAIQHFAQDPAVQFLPLGIDDLPLQPLFDTVFSMGVLYHRRAPLEFLGQLRQLLKPGGELVLETLVVPGDAPDDAQRVLTPLDRYAGMRNVWQIPSIPALEIWLARTGFRQVRLVDLNQTTPEEQRSTTWSEGQSLADFLDPTNPQLTREGYPAPLRAVLLASI